MAFPEKGSSRITVDGTVYRWRIRQKPTYNQGAYGTAMNIAVQAEIDPACVLLVRSDSPRPDNWLELPAHEVTPSQIQRYILDALSRGWEPNQNGSAFILDDRTGW